MPFVLTTDNPTDGDAYWGPAGSGGLADWSEDGDGNLYPNNDGTQDLGLPTNRVDRFFGVQTILSLGDQPTVYPGEPTTVQSIILGGGALDVEGGAFTGVLFGGPGVVGRNRSAGGIVAGVAVSVGGDPAFLYGGPGGPGVDFAPCLVLGLAYAYTGPAAISARNGGFALGRAFSSYGYGGSVYAGAHSVGFGLAFDSGTAGGTIVSAETSLAFGQAHGGFVGVSGDTSLAFGRVYEATIQVQGGSQGSMAWGYAADNGAVSVDGRGAFAGGYANGGGVGVAAAIQATNEGAFAFGGAFGGPGTRVLSSGVGAVAVGHVTNDAEIRAEDSGACAGGFSYAASVIRAQSSGSFAWGRAGSYGTISVEQSGASAMGLATYDGTLRSAADGGHVSGVVSNSGYIGVGLGGNGGLAFGSAQYGSIRVTGVGGFAGGVTAADDITASGYGSFAFGQAVGANIVASAANSAQFFPGTNNLTNSLKVGADDYGLRLIGDGVAGIRNGDLWCDGLDVFVFSGGAVRNLSNVP